MTFSFELQNTTKRFGRTVALDNISFAAPRHSVIGLIGKNGSGKTTLIRHVIGLYLPTSGECRTLGVPARELGPAELSRIGVAHQADALFPWMTARQLFRYVSSFYRSWDIALQRQLVEQLEIDDAARLGAMSPGNAQKVSLVAALCHRPELLLLDEPLSALDPIARQAVLAMLLDYFRDERPTIVVSSHILTDIERVAERVLCLDAGRVVADTTLDDLKERYGQPLEHIFRHLTGADRAHAAAAGSGIQKGVAV